MFCSNCGNKFAPTGKYCQFCGKFIDSKELDNDKTKKEELANINNYPESTNSNLSYLINEAKKTAKGIIKQGILWCLAGVVITGITYLFAEPGETYYILWGLIIFGGYKLLQGIYYYSDPQKLVDKVVESFKKESGKQLSVDNQPGKTQKKKSQNQR